jgi:hypothetical protein
MNLSNSFRFGAYVSLYTLLTGCTVTGYDLYGRGGSTYPRSYGAPAAPGLLVNQDFVDYETPYYISGGINYYYASGRYVRYVNGRRLYVSSLPRGGYYNQRHPLYGRRPAMIRGYSSPTPSAPPTRSFPNSPYSGGSRRPVSGAAPSPKNWLFRSSTATPVPPPLTPPPHRCPLPTQTGGRSTTPAQRGRAPAVHRAPVPTGERAEAQAASEHSRSAPARKKSDQP